MCGVHAAILLYALEQLRVEEDLESLIKLGFSNFLGSWMEPFVVPVFYLQGSVVEMRVD